MRRAPLPLRLLACYQAETCRYRRVRLGILILKLAGNV